MPRGRKKAPKSPPFDLEMVRQNLIKDTTDTMRRVMGLFEPNQNQVHQAKLAHDIFIHLTENHAEAKQTVDKALEAYAKAREKQLEKRMSVVEPST